MNRLTAALVLGALLAPAVGAAPETQPAEPTYPTNMAMLTDAARSAVSEMFMSFKIPRGASVLLESENDHEARWFVENLILDQLTERGVVVTLRPEEPSETPAQPGRKAAGDSAGVSPEDTVSSVPDTTQAQADTTQAGGIKPGLFQDTLDDDPDPEVDYVLRFRVAECGLTYPRAFRKSPFGSKVVERFASVSVFGTVVRGDRESVVWVGRGDAERLDHVPSGKLGLLEGKTFPFTHPELESRGIGAYAEPALVLGIVLGLIYLFYSNQ